MKRFTKMLALGLAAVLVFGMSAQAAPSVDTSSYAGGTIEGGRSDVKGSDLKEEVKTAVVEKIKSDAAVAEKIGNPEKVVVVGGFDLEIVDEAAKGKDVTVAMAGVKKENKYMLLHFSDSYELLEAILIENADDGKITFKLGDSASPFVLVDMGEKEPEPDPTNPPSNDDSSKPQETSPAVAPKTGETVPVAGIMALVLMAGAVICAKKARYNR